MGKYATVVAANKGGGSISIVENTKKFRVSIDIDKGFARFIMRDQKGKERIALIQKGNMANIGFMDAKNIRLLAGLNDEGASIKLLDENTKVRTILGAIEMANFQTKSRTIYGEPSLIFFDAKEQPFFRIPK